MIREMKGPATSTRQEGGGREGTSGKMQPSVCEESQQGKGTALFSTVPKGGCGPKDMRVGGGGFSREKGGILRHPGCPAME